MKEGAIVDQIKEFSLLFVILVKHLSKLKTN